MRLGILASVLSFGMVAGLAPAADPDSGYQPGPPANDPKPLSLLPVPKIKRAQPMKATEAEAKEIRRLIKGLAKIDELYFGIGEDQMYFRTGFLQLHRNCFAPLSSSKRFFYTYDVDEKPHPSFKALVEYGPKAIPFLLEALDDDSPTMLVFAETQRYPWNDLATNPVNAFESTALTQLETGEEDERVGRYTVTVGDICLVVLGQITNRPYSVVWDQPALSESVASPYLVQSPVENKAVADVVRQLWGDSDQAQKLLDSLLIDFNTRGDGSDSLQCGAAMRLAFYFSDEASPLIVDRLNGLDVTTEDIGEHSVANGVNAAEFIYAVSWSPDPRIASEVLKIFEKKPHSMTVLACLPGMNNDNDDAVIQRLVEFLNGPGENDFPYLDCLVAIGERLPDRATEVFQNYIDSRNVERCRYLCVALTKTCGNLSIDLLAPLLSTKARTGYLIVRDGNVEPQRLCDIAASTIAVNFPNLPFDLMDTGERRDQQIKVMKRKIGEMKKAEK